MTTHYGIGMQTDSSELSHVKWSWLMCLEIISLSQMTVLSLNAGPRIKKKCNILITDNSFSSNLTKRSFSTHSFENLSCKSYNVMYAIECALCGLIYVGETKGELRKRMNGHRSSINTGGNQLLYKHFNLPDHSVLSMKIRILEKIYHPTNSLGLSTPFRRKREAHWIRQQLLGTAAPYGCNDHIDSIGNLTSPGCQSVNVLNLFDRTSRRHRSHGSRKYNKPEIHNVFFDGLLPFVNLQLGLHHIRTRLYSLPLNMLHDLYEFTLTLHFADAASPEHRFRVLFWTFPQTDYSKLSVYVITQRQKIAHFWK